MFSQYVTIHCLVSEHKIQPSWQYYSSQTLIEDWNDLGPLKIENILSFLTFYFS